MARLFIDTDLPLNNSGSRAVVGPNSAGSNESNESTKSVIWLVSDYIDPLLLTDNIRVVIDTFQQNRLRQLPSGGHRAEPDYIDRKTSLWRKHRLNAGTYVVMTTAKAYGELQVNHELIYPWASLLIESIISGHEQLTRDPILDSLAAEAMELDIINKNEQIVDQRMGRLILYSPLSLKNTASLYYWLKNSANSVYWGAVIMALIDSYGPSYYRFPLLNRETVDYRRTYFKDFMGNDDVETMINLWKRLSVNTDQLDQWIKEHKLRPSTVKRAVKTVEELLDLLDELGYSVEEEPPTISTSELVNSLQLILIKTYADELMELTGKTQPYYRGADGSNYALNQTDSLNQLYLNYPERLLALISQPIDEMISTIGVALNVSPTVVAKSSPPESDQSD